MLYRGRPKKEDMKDMPVQLVHLPPLVKSPSDFVLDTHKRNRLHTYSESPREPPNLYSLPYGSVKRSRTSILHPWSYGMFFSWSTLPPRKTDPPLYSVSHEWTLLEWWYRNELLRLLPKDHYSCQLCPDLSDDVVVSPCPTRFYQSLNDLEEE